MQKVIITSGCPGSGKSTWANEFVKKSNGKWVNVNRDDLRAMLNNGHVKSNEKFIRKIRNQIMLSALDEGKNVIISDTNCYGKGEEEIRNALNTFGVVEVEIKHFFTPIEECIKRDLARPNSVGEKVIREMYSKYFEPLYRAAGLVAEPEKCEKYHNDEQLPRCVISDLDGTIALMVDRKPYDWHKVGQDVVNEAVRHTLARLAAFNKIIFFSGRDEVCRPETEQWLKENFNQNVEYELYMRPQGDNRKDAIMKQELFDKHIRDKYHVVAVFDDRDQCVKLWRDLGLSCFQVNYGNF